MSGIPLNHVPHNIPAGYEMLFSAINKPRFDVVAFHRQLFQYNQSEIYQNAFKNNTFDAFTHFYSQNLRQPVQHAQPVQQVQQVQRALHIPQTIRFDPQFAPQVPANDEIQVKAEEEETLAAVKNEYKGEPIKYHFNHSPIEKKPEQEEKKDIIKEEAHEETQEVFQEEIEEDDDEDEEEDDEEEELIPISSSLNPASKKIKKPAKEGSSDKTKASAKGKKKKTRRTWTSAEDAQLLELVKKYGKKWAKIASFMETRNGKQVRDHYLNALVPDINRGVWTPEEDEVIIKLYSQLGAQWCRISECLPGRTETQVKGRFYTQLKKYFGK